MMVTYCWSKARFTGLKLARTFNSFLIFFVSQSKLQPIAKWERKLRENSNFWCSSLFVVPFSG